jgi:ATP-dependent protease ClpP protease subunit
MAKPKSRKRARNLALIGDVDVWEAETIKELVDLSPDSECVFYMDSAGGSVYGALAVVALLRLKRIKASVYVLSECSSAALLIFGACKHRYVTPCSTFLFHRMRWQSEKRVASEEAHHWARHFEQLETDLDELQHKLFGAAGDKVRAWTSKGQYVTGREIAAAGLAELVEF